MELFTKTRSFLRHCFFYSIAQLATLVKVSYVFGTLSGFFSLSSLVIPAGAASFGLTGIFGASMGVWLIHAFFAKSFLLGLAYQVPTLCASLSFSGNRFIFYGILPAVCMILFLTHPASVGGQAYALYWFIPMILGICNAQLLFLRSLAATFIAHAVGSVLWLYAGKISGNAWLALMPIVAVERIVFACIMTGAALFFASLKNRSYHEIPSVQRAEQGL